MLTATEEKLLKYIEERARENIRGKTFYKMTDVLEHAFLISQERAYDVLRNLISKNIGNSKDAIINEYIDMLKKGYGSIQEQADALGENKLSSVIYAAETRLKQFPGGTFLDILREVYKIPDKEIMEVAEKYLKYLNSTMFSYKLEKETFHKFLEENLDELDKQFNRFVNL